MSFDEKSQSHAAVEAEADHQLQNSELHPSLWSNGWEHKKKYDYLSDRSHATSLNVRNQPDSLICFPHRSLRGLEVWNLPPLEEVIYDCSFFAEIKVDQSRPPEIDDLASLNRFIYMTPSSFLACYQKVSSGLKTFLITGETLAGVKPAQANPQIYAVPFDYVVKQVLAPDSTIWIHMSDDTVRSTLMLEYRDLFLNFRDRIKSNPGIKIKNPHPNLAQRFGATKLVKSFAIAIPKYELFKPEFSLIDSITDAYWFDLAQFLTSKLILLFGTAHVYEMLKSRLTDEEEKHLQELKQIFPDRHEFAYHFSQNLIIQREVKIEVERLLRTPNYELT